MKVCPNCGSENFYTQNTNYDSSTPIIPFRYKCSDCGNLFDEPMEKHETLPKVLIINGIEYVRADEE